jgi:uncharacterized protein (TIGR00369 family)
MSKFSDDNRCFVCGKGNPHGLQFQFEYDPEQDRVTAEIRFMEKFQGWQGVVHGGLISTVLDEVMVKTTGFKNLTCVTAELLVKFKNPAFVNTPYQAIGKILEIKRKLVFTEGFLQDAQDRIIASARGKFFIVDKKNNTGS